MTFELYDLVMTNRLGADGDMFEVVDIKGSGQSRTLLLKNTRTQETGWLYEAHCFASFELKKANIRNRRLRRERAAAKILAKPVRRR